ncbi:MAG: 30S ribosomal protein S12 methylthiotransferase RimO [Firmicutes bacterium]|jgi:ribosomal protein S12 methylthiotransferase|nr:30S ribosomal protein S12 methylthiotransferase RimO [Bacillota bacterium]
MAVKVGIVSLGCAKNLVDSEIMLGRLREHGCEIVADAGQADYVVVNTCGFIGPAKEESIETILEMAELKERGRCRGLIVSGCLVQRYADELFDELPEVDAFLGTNELDKIDDVISDIEAGRRIKLVGSGFYDYDQPVRRLLTTGHLAYLKIAEGCNHRCAFCVIPQIRGKFRSRHPQSLVQEAVSLRTQGVQELLVIAQDTTAYGRDLERVSLASLLEEILAVGFPWVRLLYTYPTSLGEDVLELLSRENTLVKYVDLPLQHVSRRVLRAMDRPGDYRSTMELLNTIRRQVPRVFIRSSFIVGFPGETEEDFAELIKFLEEARLNHVGIFQYSPEEGSKAAAMSDQVPDELKQERYQEAMAVQQRISRELNEELVGQELDVMIDGVSEESELVLVGRHQGQAPEVDGVVYLGMPENAPHPGDLVRVRIVEAHTYDLVGEVVGP